MVVPLLPVLSLVLASGVSGTVVVHEGDDALVVRESKHADMKFSESSTACPDPEDFCSVRDFLAGLTIDIPPSLIPPQTAMGFAVDITKLHISNIQVGGIQSRRVSRNLAVDVVGLGADIIGAVHYSGFLMNDTIDFTVQMLGSSANLEIEFVSGPQDHYPSGIAVHTCSMQLVLENLKVTGTRWSSSMITSVQGLVQSAIKMAVRRWACTRISDDLKQITVLRDLGTYLQAGDLEPPLTESDLGSVMDWKQVPIVKWVSDVVDKHLRLDGIKAILRELIPDMTQALYAETIQQTVPLYGMAQEFLGNMTILVDRLALSSGIGALRDLKFPDFDQRRDDASLRLSWAVPDTMLTGHVRLAVDPTIAGMGNRQLTAGFKFSMELSSIVGFMDVTALVTKSLDSKASRFRSITAWNPACTLPSVGKVYVADANVDFAISGFSLVPLYASDNLAGEVDDLINNFVGLFLVEFPTLPKDALSKAILDGARPMVNDMIHDGLYRARILAPPSLCTDNAFKDSMSDIFLHGSCVLLGLAGSVFFLSWMVLEPLLKSIAAPLPLTCLAADPAVAGRFMLSMPLVIVSVITLFLSSSFSLGAAVVAVLEMPGEDPVILPPVFEFTLDSTIAELWEAGVYVLMFLVGVFSGLFPYVKLILLLTCWVSPTSFMSRKTRGGILRVVDVLGKWSLVDVYVMVMFMVSFEFSMPIRDASFRVLVEPRYGFAAFVIATVASMTCGHLLLSWHDYSMPEMLETAGSSNKAIASVRVQMGMALHSRISGAAKPWRFRSVSEMLSRPSHRNNSVVLSSGFWKALLPAVLLSCLFCVIMGSKLPLITFSYTGLTGRLLEVTQGPGASRKTLSLLSIGLGLSEVVPADAHRLGGIYWLQLMYFVLSAGVVVLYIMVIIICYLVPIYFPFRKRFLAFTRTVHAWMSLDVLVISVIAAVAQIDMFTQFMIGHKCDVINYFLENLFRNQVDEATCFRVEPRFEAGTVLLSIAVLLAVPVGSLVVHGLEKVTEELDAEAETESIPEERHSELARSTVASAVDSVEMSPYETARGRSIFLAEGDTAPAQ